MRRAYRRDRQQNTYRGQVKIMPSARNARNFTQCDSLLIGEDCGAHTVPYIEVRNPARADGARSDDIQG